MWRSIITWEAKLCPGGGLQLGDVFGIYIEGKLCGFIGCHNDGSMGMLYVRMHTADKDLQHPWKVI